MKSCVSGVRLIAINDGVDSARGDDDFTPFPNIYERSITPETPAVKSVPLSIKGKSQNTSQHGHLRLSLNEPETNG